MEFGLEGCEFIELNKLLKILRLVESGGQANMFIAEGYVKLNGVAEFQKRKKLRAGDRIDFNGQVVNIKG